MTGWRWGSVVLVAAMVLAAPAAAAPPAPFSMTTTPDGVQHMHFSYGPLNAAAGQNLILVGPQSVASPPEDGYIIGFKPGLVGPDGDPPPVEQVHMHHAVFLNLSRHDVTRPELPERMYAFAEEKTYGKMPAGYGYPFKASDVLGLNYMLHNETAEDRQVWLTYDLDFVPAGTPLAAKIRPARPVWLDVQNGKAYPVFDVHRGAGGADGLFTYPDDAHNPYGDGPKLNEWTVDHDGSLIVTAGHVHPGGLWTDLKLQRGARTAELFRSVADYFDPSGPVSWDMAMTVTPPSWKVAVDKGDTLKVSATYDTRRASWYEVMGIMLVYMVDDRSGAADPFGHDFPTRGAPTHGQLKEATNFGGGPSGKPDPTTLPGAQAFGGRVGIADFAYLPGDQFSALTTPAPPVVQAGQSLDFANLDEMGSVLHTVTACRAPCNGATGVSYPLADGPVDFDSGELGYGPKGYTAASNRGDWQTPKNLPPGTYTYFCRVHPFMRGSFRVVGSAPAAGGSSTSSSRARAHARKTIVRVRHGVARVRVGCRRAGEACRGRLVARWRGRTVATARFAIPPRRTRAVAMRLTRAGRAALRSRRRLAVRLTVRGRGTARSRVTFVAAR